MYYEVRIKKGRKVVFSLCVTSMDDAMEWFCRYAASSNTTTARTSSTIRFVFFMTFYPQNIVFARLLTIAIVYRIFIFHTRP